MDKILNHFMKKLFYIVLILMCNSISSYSQVGELLWEENFNTLDNWIIETGNGNWGWGNGELQYYSPDNVSISAIENEDENNALKIVARKESGANIIDQWGNRLDFTSGRLNSKSKVSITFGMVETRISVPSLETGGWPAFWLLGTSNLGWPSKGELDMMEMGHTQAGRDKRDEFNGGNNLDNSTENDMVGANAIFFSENAIVPGNLSGAASLFWDEEFSRPYFNMNTPLIDRFLIYRMYWDSTSIRFTVLDDDIEYDLFTEPFQLNEESQEFLEPFYFIVNMAIGGTLTDAYQLGDPSSGEAVSMSLPAEMFVDYIRVYEWNNQGTVHLGPPTPKVERYGLYTDSTQTNEAMFNDDLGNIWVWENTLSAGSIDPFEGENVLSWKTNGAGWFGAGIQSVQPINLSQFSDGTLNFNIKIPANVSFQIGVIDTWGNQNYVNFPAGQNVYGLERNNEWGEASIPVSDLRGLYIDMRMLSYEFVILETNGANMEFAIDDIFYEDGVINTIEDPLIDGQPSETILFNNYPNPFNPLTNISFNLPTSGAVELSIYNLQGQKIATLINTKQSAGTHTVQWDASGYSSGIYFYRLVTENGFTETKSLVLLK